MDQKNFLEKMMDLLDVEEEPSMDSNLEDFEEWDSLAYVTFLAMANRISNKRIAPEDVKAAKTIADLFNLLN